MSPDITMCSPETLLEICKDCYRITAKPSSWQSYSRYAPINNTKCEYKIVYETKEWHRVQPLELE